MKATKIILSLLLVCLPALNMQAQKQKENEKRDDTPYLAGAVPQDADGKVVFTREYHVDGMSREDIFNKSLEWMQQRLAKNENSSRVVLQDKEKNQIVGIGEEWIVFSSSFLSLDRTRILYQLSIETEPEKCKLEVSKIRYDYREGQERYNAEEWIVDKYALNKKKTKLVRGLAKWRRKTVDFVDDLGKELAQALSITIAPTVTTTEATNVSKKPIPTTPKSADNKQLKEIAPAELSADVIQSGAGKLVITIGEDPFNSIKMTANAGGSLGEVEGKKVVFTILSPEQETAAMNKAETYTVQFYPNGDNQPSVVLRCKKMPAPQAIKGMPATFVGEITKAEIKK